jgi:hypothetical protein
MTEITTNESDAQTIIPSPFLPNTFIQYAWDSTSLGYMKTCPRLYQYQMIEGYAPKGESIHLRFGIEYHKALEDYERGRAAKLPHDDALHDALREMHARTWDWQPEAREGKRSEELKSKFLLYALVIGYCDKYKDDPAQTYIMQDGRAAVEVSFRFELDWGPQFGDDITGVSSQPYMLCGHLDRIVDFNDGLYFMDHKTASSTPGSYYFDQFHPNNQMTLYTLASQIILESPIRGGIITAAQLLKEDAPRFVRGFTYRTPDQINEWLGDLKFLLAQAEDYAAEGYWPMNDTACDKFGGCRFRDICQKSPGVRDSFLKSNFDQLPEEERWNPLKPR